MSVIVGALPPPELMLQASHLDCGHRCFESFVARLQPCAIDGLLQVVTGEHAPAMRDAGVLRGLSDAARDFFRNVFVVRSLPTQQATERDDGIHLAGLRQRTGGARDLECTRNAHDKNVFIFRSGAVQTIEGAGEQALGDELIEARDHDAEAQPVRVHLAFNGFVLRLGWVLGLHSTVLPRRHRGTEETQIHFTRMNADNADLLKAK